MEKDILLGARAMKFCPKCEREVSDDYLFCTVCASELVGIHNGTPDMNMNEVVLNRSILQQIGHVNVEGMSREEIEKVVADYLETSHHRMLIKEEIDALIQYIAEQNKESHEVKIRKMEMEENKKQRLSRREKITEWDRLRGEADELDRELRSMKREIYILEHQLGRELPRYEDWGVMFLILAVALGFLFIFAIFWDELVDHAEVVGGMVVMFYTILLILLYQRNRNSSRAERKLAKSRGDTLARLNGFKGSFDELHSRRSSVGMKLERLSAEIKGLDNLLGIPHLQHLDDVPEPPDKLIDV